jgi:kinesin family protein 11
MPRDIIVSLVSVSHNSNRPRNAKEIRDNSPSIVSTMGAKGRELVLKPSATEPLTKTYTFDKVFGPECDQETVYKEVVSGMLDEVLLGYSATIFAYGEFPLMCVFCANPLINLCTGQTGTGKTHTMLGDMSPIDGPQVGIIPRTLLNLFETLERDTAEYSVRVSFLELYNEELRDLLSADDDFKKLRVFEDLSRKGSIVIHGLEEVLVKNAADVLAILHKGSLKKQIAATKLNENSRFGLFLRCLNSIEG